MKISLVSAPAAELNVDALAVPVATGQRLSGAALELDRAMGGVLGEMADAEGRLILADALTHALRNVVAHGSAGGVTDRDGRGAGERREVDEVHRAEAMAPSERNSWPPENVSQENVKQL